MASEDLTPKQVLNRFRGTALSRDLLYVWARKGWVKATRHDQGNSEAYSYPETEMSRVAALLWGYSLGLAPAFAQRLASVMDVHLNHPSGDLFLERFRQLFRAIEEISAVMLNVADAGGVQQFADKAGELVPSECCSVFLVDDYFKCCEQPRQLKLVAQIPRPFDAKIIDLHDDPKGGLTGGLARRGELVMFHGATLAHHALLNGGPPQAPGVRQNVLAADRADTRSSSGAERLRKI